MERVQHIMAGKHLGICGGFQNFMAEKVTFNPWGLAFGKNQGAREHSQKEQQGGSLIYGIPFAALQVAGMT